MRKKQNLWVSHSQKDVSVSFTEIILQKIVLYICCQSPNVYLTKDKSGFFDSSAKDFSTPKVHLQGHSSVSFQLQLLLISEQFQEVTSKWGGGGIVSAQLLQHRHNIYFEDIQLRSIFCVKSLSSQYPPTVGTEQLK